MQPKYVAMIDYLKGELTDINPTYAVVECNGVGYEVNINLIDYVALKDMKDCKIYVHEAIREDAHLLYGFLTKSGRELFRLLIGVSGVGPNTARLIMSSLEVQALQGVITQGDERTLKAVKGVGAKTAQRIIVDLRDKIKADEETLITSKVSNEAYDDSLAALVMLGFTAQQSNKVLKKLFAADPGLTTEKAIKQALTML